MRFLSTAAATAVIMSALTPVQMIAQGGHSAAIFLELPASARAMALGGAAVTADGESAIFYNPAQLALVERAAAGLSVQRYIFSSTLGAMAAATRLGPGSIGVGVQVLEYGSEDEIVPDDAFGGETGIATGAKIDAGDLAATVAYAIRRGRVRVGMSGKVIRQRIVDESGTAGALDFGVAVTLPRGAAIGAVMQNLGTKLETGSTSASLPRLVRVGGSIPFIPSERISLLLAADVIKPRVGDAVAGGGIEMRWQASPSFALAGRAGGMMVPGDDDGSPLTAGAAVIGRHLAIDYAFRSFDIVGGAMHRIGVRWWR
jgi:hypothetical protein